MKCLNCETEIETDDNFCWKCGHWTSKGYAFLKKQENIDKIINGAVIKQSNRITILESLLSIGVIIFVLMMLIKGNDLFRPIGYLKKLATNYIYGYNTSIIKTNNKYNALKVNSYEEAIELIKSDFSNQSFYCNRDIDLSKLEIDLETNYSIPSVLFCDMSYDEATKVSNVIAQMYNSFPNIQGALTNITITNASSASEYIAYFQPMYQFVNINEDIKEYNKVNKTQILLNSYYFLNEEILANPIENVTGEGWYVEDATWESTIAHEMGHYISFVIFLKKYNLENITYVTEVNFEIIENAFKEFDSGQFSTDIVNDALNNYNLKYNSNLNIDDFALTISKYAGIKDKNGKLIADETIAEAIHDYYLHKNEMKPSSNEIIKIIKEKMR